MKKMVVGIAATLAPCFALASGGVLVGGGYYTGNDFMSMGDAQRNSVVAAMVTMLNAGGMAGSPDEYQKKLSSCLAKVDARQLSAALENYLKSKPEQWDTSLGIPVAVMLDGFCAKRGHPLNRAAMFTK